MPQDMTYTWERNEDGEDHTSQVNGDRSIGHTSDTDVAAARFRVPLVILLLAYLVLWGCELIPQKPEAVFDLYRDRMKAGNLDEARILLSIDSRNLVNEMVSAYHLKHPPENLALLNALDPVASPATISQEKTTAVLKLRTLRGGFRLIRLKKEDERGEWGIDMTAELESFRSFLQVRKALGMIREQAAEYAATLKEFNDQIDRMPKSE